MAEATKVRLVRCPNCENVLKEEPDFTVYQCGGCGAVLRAKTQSSVSDSSSEKSDEERSRTIGNSEEKESEVPELVRRRRRPVALSERVVGSTGNSPSMPENREFGNDNNGGRLDKEPEHGYPSKAPAVDAAAVFEEMNLRRDELAKGTVVGEIESQASANRPLGPAQIPDSRSSETKGSLPFRRTHGDLVEDVRFPTFQYPDEGPSNYYRGLSYGYGEPVKNQSNLDGPSRVEYLEQDRAELLRKLEELKDQLSRSCDIAEKPKERVPVARRSVPLPPPPPADPYSGHGTWSLEGMPGSSRASVPSFAPDKHIFRPPYLNYGHEPIPLTNRHHVDMQQKFHPPLRTPNEILAFGDPFGSQMLRRAPHQPALKYSQRSGQGYFTGHHVDVDSDPIALYPHNSLFDQTACSCFHCYNKQWQIPGQIHPSLYGNRRYPDVPSSTGVNHLETSVPFSSLGCNPRVFNPPAYSHELDEHARKPILRDSDMEFLNRGRPQKMVPANWSGRLFHPIAGGAPFITCHNCFELLRLPKKLLLMGRNERKVQCGSCSAVIPIVVEHKRLHVSVPAGTKQTPPEVHGSSSEVLKEGSMANSGYSNEASVNSYADDYDNSNYVVDPDDALLAEDQRVNSSESRKVHGQLSSSSSPSDYDSSDSVTTRREMSNTVDMPLRENVTTPVPGSPLQEKPDHPSCGVVSNLEEGSRSKRLGQEEVAREDSLKDASVATEMDVSLNEYSNTVTSQDSREANKEEDQAGVSNALEAFFASLVKKSYRESSKSNRAVENDKSNVSINGHPIPHHIVKKAEKLAGPISPGEYWYDFRAGFWGPVGQPCRGIIPPFIDEFNHPMPQNCAGGNTGVFVNGRELHQKDLDLLAGRGLPTTRDKSYIVDISGTVVDEDSGEELDSLGKLAPTVEKAKHGFGMRGPRVAR